MRIKPQHVTELESFLDLCHPEDLKKTIQFLYFSYTMDKDNLKLLPEDFDEMSSDVFLLLEFIDKLIRLHDYEAG